MKVFIKLLSGMFCVCICSVLLSGCINGCNIMNPPMSVKEMRSYTQEKFGVTLPERIEIKYYAFEAWVSDGVHYYIYEYDGYDEQFNSTLSDEAFSEDLKRHSANAIKLKFYENCAFQSKEFYMPDLNSKCSWSIALNVKYPEEEEEAYKQIDSCAVYYFYEENLLLVHIFNS